jgi:hypothetical protein
MTAMHHNAAFGNLAAALLLFVLLVLGCSSGKQNNKGASNANTRDPKEETKARFEALRDDYAKLPATTRLTSAPYIKGKIVYLWNRSLPGGGEEISINTGYLDDNSKLSSIYARSPDEVQTVVFQICKRVDSGKVYVDPLKPEIAQKPLPALIWKCEITLVDRTIPAVIHKREIQSKLPQTITVRDTQKEGGGPPPWQEVGDFLLSLPRK